MRTRKVVAVLLLLLGALWIFQGIGVAKGSFMTGQAVWAVIGGVAAIAGVLLLASTPRAR